MATRARGATFRANERPAMPLPRTTKSKLLSISLRLEQKVRPHPQERGKTAALSQLVTGRTRRSQRCIIDQPRVADEHGQRHLRAAADAGRWLKRIGVKKLDIIDLGVRLLLDELAQVIF